MMFPRGKLFYAYVLITVLIVVVDADSDRENNVGRDVVRDEAVGDEAESQGGGDDEGETNAADDSSESSRDGDDGARAPGNDTEKSGNAFVNATAANANSCNCVNNSVIQVTCMQNRMQHPQTVEIVNAVRLASILHVEGNVTSKQTPGNCVAVLFYSPTCPFSCLAAPAFNALPRYFPDVKMVAVDAITHRSFSAQYGIFGTPTLLLFHNGITAARLDETHDYSLEMFAKFIKARTNIKPSGKLVVTSADFSGPISTVLVEEEDYYLLLSWIVIGLQLLYSFYRSSWGRWLVDATLSAWREAEAQHHHHHHLD